MKVLNYFLSYIIILTVMSVMGLSIHNSIDAIHQKNITLYHPVMPKIEIDLFNPIIQSVLADSK